jgi:uncharacterized oligopeptide transporter (OPT) family protein
MPSDTRTAASASGHHRSAPIQWDAPQLAIRAVGTGVAPGAVLWTCNIYAGLKIGWGFNMCLTGALLSFGLCNGLHQLSGKRVRHWGILENNNSQTACSSTAYVSSTGLRPPQRLCAV